MAEKARGPGYALMVEQHHRFALGIVAACVDDGCPWCGGYHAQPDEEPVDPDCELVAEAKSVLAAG